MMPNDISNQNQAAARSAASRITAVFNFLIGLWLFASPWVYGAADHANAWNAWIVGGLIALLAAIRFFSPYGAPGLARINTILAIWVFVSPWVYGYTGNTSRLANSLCVGVAVFVLSIAGGAVRRPMRHAVVRH